MDQAVFEGPELQERRVVGVDSFAGEGTIKESDDAEPKLGEGQDGTVRFVPKRRVHLAYGFSLGGADDGATPAMGSRRPNFRH